MEEAAFGGTRGYHQRVRGKQTLLPKGGKIEVPTLDAQGHTRSLEGSVVGRPGRTPLKDNPTAGPWEEVFGPGARAIDGVEEMVFGTGLLVGAGVTKAVEGGADILVLLGIEVAEGLAAEAASGAASLARGGVHAISNGGQAFVSGVTFGLVRPPGPGGGL